MRKIVNNKGKYKIIFSFTPPILPSQKAIFSYEEVQLPQQINNTPNNLKCGFSSKKNFLAKKWITDC